jgi:hypothetical protein
MNTTTLKTGELNNCKNCLSTYGKYTLDGDSDFSEYWGKYTTYEGEEIKKPKGLCQFCNPKSRYYIEAKKDEEIICKNNY